MRLNHHDPQDPFISPTMSLLNLPPEIIAKIGSTLPLNNASSITALYHTSGYIRACLGERFWKQACTERFERYRLKRGSKSWMETFLFLHQTRCHKCLSKTIGKFPFQPGSYGACARICANCERSIAYLDEADLRRYAISFETDDITSKFLYCGFIGYAKSYVRVTTPACAEQASLRRWGSFACVQAEVERRRQEAMRLQVDKTHQRALLLAKKQRESARYTAIQLSRLRRVLGTNPDTELYKSAELRDMVNRFLTRKRIAIKPIITYYRAVAYIYSIARTEHIDLIIHNGGGDKAILSLDKIHIGKLLHAIQLRQVHGELLFNASRCACGQIKSESCPKQCCAPCCRTIDGGCRRHNKKRRT